MSKRVLRYENDDGEERFAVYSTIVEGWTWYDLTEDELLDDLAGSDGFARRETIKSRIEDIRQGKNPYPRWDPEDMRSDLLDDLESDTDE